MLKMFYKALNNDKGFTLIELIVVIAVLGILATVVLPRIGGITTKAKTAADIATIKTINNSIEIYISESGDDDISDLDTTTATDLIDDLQSGITVSTVTYGPYLKDEPTLKTGVFGISGTSITDSVIE